MSLVLIGEELPDRGDGDNKRQALQAYNDMLKGICFNVLLVNKKVCEKFIKDMTPEEYEEYQKLLIVLKNMSNKERPFSG